MNQWIDSPYKVGGATLQSAAEEAPAASGGVWPVAVLDQPWAEEEGWTRAKPVRKEDI